MQQYFFGMKRMGPIVSLVRFYWLFFSCLLVELGASGRKQFHFTRHRIFVLATAFICIPVLMVWNHLGFILDNWLFPAWVVEEVEKPLFIVGNARSGTTFFHRLVTETDQNSLFSTMRTWEIVFAQSTAWKVLILYLYRLDANLAGGVVYSTIQFIERKLVGHIKVHAVGLQLPEEDEWLMVSIGLSQLIMFVFPLGGHLLDPLIMFDMNDAVPSPIRQEIFSFYKGCVQKHLYARRLLSEGEGDGPTKIFVSKNPPFTMRLRSLLKAFPDARVACMMREPMESVPSMVSYIGLAWSTFASPANKYPQAQGLVGFCEAHYKYPQAVFGSAILPKAQCTYVQYARLVATPGVETVRCLEYLYRTPKDSDKDSPGSSPSRLQKHRHIDLDHMSEGLREEDKRAAEKAYSSDHKYSLEVITGDKHGEAALRSMLASIYKEHFNGR